MPPPLRLTEPDFLSRAQQSLPASGILSGTDQDFAYAVLDARRFDMTIVQCHPSLTGVLEKMPRPPAAVINAQFIRSTGTGFAPEGEVVRGSRRVHKDSRMNRWFLAQLRRPKDARGYLIGKGNPWSVQRYARVAIGGLGVVLNKGRPVTATTGWMRSTFEQPEGVGRGVLAIDRTRDLILLLVQGNCFFCDNATTMTGVQTWLQNWGVRDAVFNDGSNSEALYAEGRWLVEPAWQKSRAMDYAIGFVERKTTHRVGVLAIDGTPTRDAHTFVQGMNQSELLHYAPRILATPVGLRQAALKRVVREGVIENFKTSSQAARRATERVVELGGVSRAWADVLYVSSHATRHGVLYYQHRDSHSARVQRFADPWSSGFKPVWRNSPRWIILVGCAVLALRYSRLKWLTPNERSGLVRRHRDIHGSRSKIFGLSKDTKATFQVYHPGWKWYQKVFQQSRIRGVLGYWYRSPGGRAGDMDILEAFVTQLNKGATLLDAWRDANHRGWFGVAAAWAAMVRKGCERDTLAALEDPSSGPSDAGFEYFDDHVGSNGRPLAGAYHLANQTNAKKKVDKVEIAYHEIYDRFAMEGDRGGLRGPLTKDNFLVYSDGVGP